MKFGFVLPPLLVSAFSAFSAEESVELVFKSRVPSTCGVVVTSDNDAGGVKYNDEASIGNEKYIKLRVSGNTKLATVTPVVVSNEFKDDEGNVPDFGVWIGEESGKSTASWGSKTNNNVAKNITPNTELYVVGLVNENRVKMFKDHDGKARVNIDVRCFDM
ncbi:hypothetical protein [Vibrio harveyi]|uniref:hypothetical protein n=1 Tax=Vibrio harveyi TaxID=669 RepID=UPI0037364306